MVILSSFSLSHAYTEIHHHWSVVAVDVIEMAASSTSSQLPRRVADHIREIFWLRSSLVWWPNVYCCASSAATALPSVHGPPHETQEAQPQY